MRRSVAAMFALLMVGLACADAAPSRQPRGPLPAEPEPLDFRGTHWFGKTYEGADWTIIFEPGGGVTNIENGITYKIGSWKATGANSVYMELNQVYYEFRGSWKLEGNKLYFEHFITPTKKLMEFHGTVKDANTIVGEATFPAKGAKEQQTLQRTTVEVK